MTTLRTRVAAGSAAVLLGGLLAGSMLLAGAGPAAAAPARAAMPVASSPTVTFQVSLLLVASVTPASVAVDTQTAVTFENDSSAFVTFTYTSSPGPAPPAFTVLPNGGKATKSFDVGTYDYSATSSDPLVRIPAMGSITVSAAPTPSTSPPAHPPTTAPAGGSGSTPNPGGGLPSLGPVTSRPTTPAPAAASGGRSGFVFAFPGGVIPSVAPGTTVNGSVVPPLVAPFPTSSDVFGIPGSTAPDASSSPSGAALASDVGGGGGGRSLGLPAAITAVLLAGVGAALLRLLLRHPAARPSAHRS